MYTLFELLFFNSSFTTCNNKGLSTKEAELFQKGIKQPRCSANKKDFFKISATLEKYFSNML